MNRVKKLILIHILLITLIFSSSTLSIAAQARNIIFMIGGGMGPAHIHTTWLYATRDLGKNLIMTEIMDKGRTAYMINDTADSTVTESAAAATQMATGVKVLARAIGIGPDGRALKTILELAKEKGKATGLVTTFMSMTEEKPEWKLSGDCVEGYTSPPVCPAYWGSPFPKDLHEGKSQCEGAWSFNIREGYHRDINLGGLRVCYGFNSPTGFPEASRPWNCILFIDDRANEQQAKALEEIYRACWGVQGEVLKVKRGDISFNKEIIDDGPAARIDVYIKGVYSFRSEPLVTRDKKPRYITSRSGGIIYVGKSQVNEFKDKDLPRTWNRPGMSTTYYDFTINPKKLNWMP